MDNAFIFSHVDHTLLKPTATTDEIMALCDEAIQYGTASVCIPPRFVKAVKDEFDDELKICTVVGFPLGYQTTEIKVAETTQALEDGADEIDMVISLGDVKEGRFYDVTAEIETIKALCGEKTLKVIIETCYLTDVEKVALCDCVTKAGADYIKTSTGFGTAGATPEDAALMINRTGYNVKVKAAGGIRTKEDMIAYLELGCDRIGTSGAVTALTED